MTIVATPDTPVGDTASPTAANDLTSEQFYSGLTTRNRGLISTSLQQRISDTRVLIAGCGSIGGATVQPLARMGYRHFSLADVGEYELNNLNRQHAVVDALGSNKAAFAAETITRINPHASCEVHVDGITPGNAGTLTATADVIVDGVDVTTSSGLAAKLELHTAALAARKPVITAWDMAGMLAAQYFDYRTVTKIFDGEITAEEAAELSPWEIVFRIAPRRHIPPEMYRELRTGLRDNDYSVPQLAEAANQFGALSVHMINVIVEGRALRDTVAVDVHNVTRKFPEQVASTISKPWEFIRFASSIGAKSTWNGFAPAQLFRIARRITT
jgi:tRNA threonylcarbamoyladenosine dehydratase